MYKLTSYYQVTEWLIRWLTVKLLVLWSTN